MEPSTQRRAWAWFRFYRAEFIVLTAVFVAVLVGLLISGHNRDAVFLAAFLVVWGGGGIYAFHRDRRRLGNDR